MTSTVTSRIRVTITVYDEGPPYLVDMSCDECGDALVLDLILDHVLTECGRGVPRLHSREVLPLVAPEEGSASGVTRGGYPH